MKIVTSFFVVITLVVFAGCNGVGARKELLSVDFQKATPLQYRFTSKRDVEINWKPNEEKVSKKRKKSADKLTESMELVITYMPVEIEPYGLTTIEATCDYIIARRKSSTGKRSKTKDAIASLRGKKFTFTVDPAGRIEDYSQLENLIKELGKKAFRPNKNRGRIKEADMICDFIAVQWFLWDSISSIENPAQGVSVGQSWSSKLSVPAPMVIRKARDVTYTLKEIRPTDKGRIAVIHSSFSPAQSAPQSWPIPYSGKFRMSGTYGFLRGYKLLSLEGSGEELFNIDAGRIEESTQSYQMQLEASFPMSLDMNPLITINQKMTTQFIKNK